MGTCVRGEDDAVLLELGPTPLGEGIPDLGVELGVLGRELLAG